MKGFARILETIIAAIIILTSLSFFLPIPIEQSGWDNQLNRITAQDAITVAYKGGLLTTYVKNNDNTSLTTYLQKFFPRSVDFSVEIKGIPNPVIYVGCACNDAQANDIKSRISPTTFSYKGRIIEIRIEKVTVTALPEETDVLLFMHIDDLNTQYTNNKNTIDRFLESGGTLFLISDLSESNVEGTTPDLTFLMKNIFGLMWNSDTNPPQDSGSFKDFNLPERISYNIAHYYENNTGKNPQTENFKKFNTNGNLINKIAVADNTIIQTDNKKFAFVAGNKNIINGNGRAAWIAENDRSLEINSLTKAVFMWASGESYKMDGFARKRPARVNQKASIIVHDKETYEFSIITWNIF